MSTTLLMALHIAATLAMFGLIWFVQVVHYPLFARVGRVGFAHFEAAHARLTSFVVVPLMVLEALTAFALVVVLPGRTEVWWGLVLLVVIWGSTLMLQVPEHRELRRGFDRDAHHRLVRGNWVRTVAWSTRAALALALVYGNPG